MSADRRQPRTTPGAGAEEGADENEERAKTMVQDNNRRNESATGSSGASQVDGWREKRPAVLVAEDDEANRELIARQLARLGCRYEIAASGHQALERWRTGRYDLLLTDLRMPDMDGFALTAAIRSEERASGRRLVIVAISANAYDEQADRCLSQGMDGYLPKPMKTSDLRALIERLFGAESTLGESGHASAGGTGDAVHAAVDPDGVSPIDAAALRELVGDDSGVVSEILNEFVQHARAKSYDLFAAARDNDPARVREVAHRLKSSARGVGAYALADLCQRLERAGELEDVPAMESDLAELESLVRAVEAQVGRC